MILRMWRIFLAVGALSASPYPFVHPPLASAALFSGLRGGEMDHGRMTLHEDTYHDDYPECCDIIDGYIAHADDNLVLPDSCFMGLNMTNCTELDGYTKPPMCIQLCARKVTINGINGERLKVAKKAVCGTSNQEVIDSSEFFLMTPQGLPSNLYGFELRFRQKKYPGDEDIVRCPIKRTACDYRGDFLLGCKAALDDTYLSKYVVKIEVKEAFRDYEKYNGVDDDTYSTDDYPDKWWHVRKCEVVDVVETTHPPDWLTEEIIFYWRPVNYTFNWMQLGWFVGFGTLILYVLYIKFVASQCVVCSKRNVGIYSNGMCWICHCLGAELPHPEVLARLRREKAARHNGSLNRLALRDMQLSFNRVFGIHQLPPMTYRSFKLAIVETFWWLVDSTSALCWTLATVLTCGLVRRRRPPKVHAVAIAPTSGSSRPLQLTTPSVLVIDQGDDSGGTDGQSSANGALALGGNKERAIEPIEGAA